MNVDTGHIDENTVNCPTDSKKVNVMRSWGKRKRQRYAHLVKIDMYTEDKAFDIVENHKGVIPNAH